MISTQSLSASKLKVYARLKDKKFRSREGIFLIEGQRAVSQVLAHGILNVVSIIHTTDLVLSPELFNLIPPDVPVYETSPAALQSISDTETAQGLACVAEIPKSWEMDAIVKHIHAPILALDAISDPGNLGTLYRTASWFGFGAILLGDGTVDLFNPKVVRSTAGAVGSLPFVTGNLPEMLEKLSQKGRTIIALDVNEHAESLYSFVPDPGVVLVAGNEAHGLSESVKQKCKAVYIPGNPEFVESLNASVAASVAMSHIHKLLM
jgi:TrmH family RNA methyltransferase